MAEASRPRGLRGGGVVGLRWGDFEDLPDRLVDAGYEVTAHPELDKVST